MDLLSVAAEAQLHHEIARDLLRGVLREEKTTVAAIAASLGVSREYLQTASTSGSARTMSVRLINQLVSQLYLPDDRRRELRDHLLLARESRLRKWRLADQIIHQQRVDESLQLLRNDHWAASYSPDPLIARAHYDSLLMVGSRLVRLLHHRQSTVQVLEVCMLLHDALSVRDRPGAALFYARLASRVSDDSDDAIPRRDKERFGHLAINARYAEGITLHNLGLDRRALDRYEAAEGLLATHRAAAGFWRAPLYGAQLKATGGLPRFSLRRAEELAAEERGVYERRGDQLDGLFLLLNADALARIYLRFGNLRKAEQQLRPAVVALATTANVGSLHKVVILRTFAQILDRLSAVDERQFHLSRALTIARAAGLEHQARGLLADATSERHSRAG